MLKPPGSKPLKLKCDILLSNVAVKFNLSRYIMVYNHSFKSGLAGRGRAVQVDPIKPTLKPPGTERLKLKCDSQLSTFAFKFNSRRYSAACWRWR